ncbi:hypothetical protein Mpet_2318 [Methanolacinia petrolearia DSM 11571]|uniref:Uncharacterized protein n=1 Tax=Methanolacinia petrolearia (strain DSM 11571 / OCM 486 / SEBR 4847) TaxID=679926 RepID=E1RD82_METP4|nr:hypothetical protein [Methanolacinia petrolearia]ADN37065.1 hypothetical protein Mpet_2318 [Methanolacinia petrolearia DSM 11571]
MSVFSTAPKIANTVTPTLRSAKDAAIGLGESAKQGLLTMVTPAKEFAKTKSAQHAVYPALVGGGLGVGSYAALSGAGAGLRTLGGETAKDTKNVVVGIIALLGVLGVLVFLYSKVK